MPDAPGRSIIGGDRSAYDGMRGISRLIGIKTRQPWRSSVGFMRACGYSWQEYNISVIKLANNHLAWHDNRNSGQEDSIARGSVATLLWMSTQSQKPTTENMR